LKQLKKNNNLQKMKKILALALVAIVAISCGQPENKQKELENLRAEYKTLGDKIAKLEKEVAVTDTTKANQTPVRIVTLTTEVFKRPVEIQGIVESDKNVLVSSEVAGRIVEVLVKEGQVVSQGQVLARVDGSITANSINEVENALQLAEVTYKKQKNLYAQNVGTEMQLLQAENQRNALKKQLETLRSQYAKYTITAPVSGTVDNVPVNSGENIMPGMPVARVVNNSQLKVTADVSEKYIKSVKKGNDVLVKFPGLDIEMEAKISSTGQIIKQANRTFDMVINLNKSNELLKPNLLAMVTIYDYINPKAIAIPSNIILTTGSESYVYVLENKGNAKIATKRVIETGNVSGALTEIKSGLSEGDNVIIENYNNLTQGAEVMVIK
jgi:membrane fusion protein, multidrug efflux system